MRFKLRRPCGQCPFRNDRPGFLNAGRVGEITHAILKDNKTFSCHKTLDGEWAEDQDESAEAHYHPGPEEQMCAGALVLIEKTGAANQMVQLAERFGLWDRLTLDMTSPVFDTAEEMIAAQ